MSQETRRNPARIVTQRHFRENALVRSHCRQAASLLFQGPSLLAELGDHAARAARARIVIHAHPDAGASIINAYFAALVIDVPIQDKLTHRVAARELVLLRAAGYDFPHDAVSNKSHGGDYI